MAPKWGDRHKSVAYPPSIGVQPADSEAEGTSSAPLDGKKAWSRPSSLAPPTVATAESSSGVADSSKKSWKRPSSLAPADAHQTSAAIDPSASKEKRKSTWGKHSGEIQKTPPESNSSTPKEKRKSTWGKHSGDIQQIPPESNSSTPNEKRKSTWGKHAGEAQQTPPQSTSSTPKDKRKSTWGKHAPEVHKMPPESSSTALQDKRKSTWGKHLGEAQQTPPESTSTTPKEKRKSTWGKDVRETQHAQETSPSTQGRNKSVWGKHVGETQPTLPEGLSSTPEETRKSTAGQHAVEERQTSPESNSSTRKEPKMPMDTHSGEAHQAPPEGRSSTSKEIRKSLTGEHTGEGLQTPPESTSSSLKDRKKSTWGKQGVQSTGDVQQTLPESTSSAPKERKKSWARPSTVAQSQDQKISSQEAIAPEPSEENMPAKRKSTWKKTHSVTHEPATQATDAQHKHAHLHPDSASARKSDEGPRKSSAIPFTAQVSNASECWTDSDNESPHDLPPDTSDDKRILGRSLLSMSASPSGISFGQSSPEFGQPSAQNDWKKASIKRDPLHEIEELKEELAQERLLASQRELESTSELEAAKQQRERDANSRLSGVALERAVLLAAAEPSSGDTLKNPPARMTKLKEQLAGTSSSFATSSLELGPSRNLHNQMQVNTLKESLLETSGKLFNLSVSTLGTSAPLMGTHLSKELGTGTLRAFDGGTGTFRKIDGGPGTGRMVDSQATGRRADILKQSLRHANEKIAMLQTTSCKFKGVDSSDELYKKIARMFRYQGLPFASIRQVLKAEMPDPYVLAYEANRGYKEEKELWLCTGGVSPRMILESPCGLDYRYSAVGKLGRGLYGAVDAVYADCFYAFKTRRQEQQLLLFRGITGRAYNYKDAKPPMNADALDGQDGALSHSVSLAGYDSAFADDICRACMDTDLGAIMREPCTCLFTQRYQPENFNKSNECITQLARRRVSSPIYCLFPPCGDLQTADATEDMKQTTADQLIDAHRLKPHVLAMPIALVEYSNPDTYNEPDWNIWYDKDATLKLCMLQEMAEEQDFQKRVQNDILQQKDQLHYELEETEATRDKAARELHEYAEIEGTLKCFELENRKELERSELNYSISLSEVKQRARDAQALATYRLGAMEERVQEAEFVQGMREAQLANELEAAESKAQNLLSELNLCEMVASTTKLEVDSQKAVQLSEQSVSGTNLADNGHSVSELIAEVRNGRWARLVLLLQRCEAHDVHRSSMRAAASTLAARRAVAENREQLHKSHALAAHRLMYTDWQMRLANTRTGLRARSMAFEQWRHQIADESSAHMAASNALLLTEALEDLKIKSAEDSPVPWSGLLPKVA